MVKRRDVCGSNIYIERDGKIRLKHLAVEAKRKTRGQGTVSIDEERRAYCTTERTRSIGRKY